MIDKFLFVLNTTTSEMHYYLSYNVIGRACRCIMVKSCNMN